MRKVRNPRKLLNTELKETLKIKMVILNLDLRLQKERKQSPSEREHPRRKTVKLLEKKSKLMEKRQQNQELKLLSQNIERRVKLVKMKEIPQRMVKKLPKVVKNPKTRTPRTRDHLRT